MILNVQANRCIKKIRTSHERRYNYTTHTNRGLSNPIRFENAADFVNPDQSVIRNVKDRSYSTMLFARCYDNNLSFS